MNDKHTQRSEASIQITCHWRQQLYSPRNSPVWHYSDVIMSTTAFQITSVWIVCSNICSGTDQTKHQSSASLAFMGANHQWPVVPLTKGQWCGKCFHLMTSSCMGKYIKWTHYIYYNQNKTVWANTLSEPTIYTITKTKQTQKNP